MLKKLAALMCCIAVLPCVSVNAGKTVEKKVSVISENFESYEGNDTGLKMRLTLNNATAEKSDNALLKGTSMRFSFDNVDFDKTASPSPFIYYSYTSKNKVSWSCDMSFDYDVVSGGFVVAAKGNSGTVYLQNVTFQNGYLVLKDVSTEKSKIKLETGKKYSFEYVVDVENQKYSFYVNNELKADKYGLQAEITSTSQFRLTTGATKDNYGYVYFDNYNISGFETVENTPPEVEFLSGDTVGINTDGAISVQAIDNEGEIKKVEFYCDDSLVDKCDDAPYELDISEYKPGKYKFKAIAYDDCDEYSFCEKEISLNFEEKETIQVEPNIKSGKIDIADIEDISFDVSGNTAPIIKAVLYIDSEVVSVADKKPFVFSKDFIKTGKHNVKIVVYDADSNRGSCSVDVDVNEAILSTLMQTDFKNYTGGTSSASLLQILNGDYTPEAKIIDNDYGNSIYFSIDESNVDAGEKKSGYVMWAPNTTESFVWKASLYYEGTPNTVYFQTVSQNSEGSSVYMANVTVNGLNVTAMDKSDKKTVATIETGKFYDFEYALDMKNQTYTLKIDGKIVAENFKFTNEVVKVNQLRLVSEFQKQEKMNFAYDNYYVGATNTFPYIEDCTLEDSETLALKITDNENVSADDIKVVNDYEEIGVLSFDKESGKAKLKSKLNPDTCYNVILKPKAKVDDVLTYGHESVKKIKTANGEKGIKDILFFVNKDTLNCIASLYNNNETDADALVIVNLYEGGKLVKTVSKAVSVGGKKTEDVELKAEGYNCCCTAKVFVLKSWQDRNAFSDAIYYKY